MKKILITALMTSVSVTAMAVELKTDDQKISYAVGMQFGTILKRDVNGPIQLDEKIFFEGIKDVLNDKSVRLNPKEADDVMQKFLGKAREFAQKKAKAAAAANEAEGKKLLEENKKKDGVKVTSSGLQYRVISEGKGKKPKVSDVVKVNYKGSFADGSTFDSSYDRGKPVEFRLDQVIAGWKEGLQLMPVGSKYEFVIPSDLAYGAAGPGKIGPNRTLIFDVELLGIEKPKAKVKSAEPKKSETQQSQDKAKTDG